MSNRTGTIVALTSALLFNGRTLNGVEFGVLANVLGDQFAVKVGTAPKPAGQRGKPATIWQLSANTPVAITEASDAPAPVAADAVDSEPVAESVEGEVVEQNDDSANPVNVDDIVL